MTLNRKIKGESIQKGSIPLSALTNELQNNINSAATGSTVLTKDIQIKGGPLANNIAENGDVWPSEWVDEKNIKIIPKNISFEDILTKLFLKEIDGTVKFMNLTWSPGIGAPTIQLSNSGTVEIGTKIKVTSVTKGEFNKARRQVTLDASQGYFENDVYHSDTTKKFESEESKSNRQTETLTYTWNGTSQDVIINETELQLTQPSNTLVVTQSGLTATVNCIPSITVYASTNTQKKLDSVSATFTEEQSSYTSSTLKNTKTVTITGARAYWMGAMATPLEKFTGEAIRNAGNTQNSGLVKYLGSSPATTLKVPAGTYDVVIATQKEISVITSAAQFDTPITGNFTVNHTEENIEGENGFTAVKYHVYHCNTDWGEDTLTITYK